MADEDTLETSGQKNRFTLAQMPENKRLAILEALTQGHGLVKTAEKFGVSHHTVESVRDQELSDNPRFASAYYQSRLPAKLLNIASKGIEQIDKRIEEIPAGALAITVGVAIDKFLALSGQSTQVVEHRHVLSSNDARSALSGDVIDV
jgi:phage portal protein BeeE